MAAATVAVTAVGFPERAIGINKMVHQVFAQDGESFGWRKIIV